LDTLIVVDMQAGLLNGPPKHDLRNVVERINAVTALVREGAGHIVRIRHCGKRGEDFERSAASWEFLPGLAIGKDDCIVEKSLNDPFAGTPLAEILERMKPDRVLISGWATDFCVDATVRSTVSRDHHVVAVGDAHTLSDRPHMSAPDVIRHHNWIWSGLITNRSVTVVPTEDLLAGGA
jgi:nicotinamidase-related amidase